MAPTPSRRTLAVSALRDRGLPQILTEGGPHLLGNWRQAGVVDELCLTLRPVVLGGTGLRIVEAAAGQAALAQFELVSALESEGDLLLRYALARRAARELGEGPEPAQSP